MCLVGSSLISNASGGHCASFACAKIRRRPSRYGFLPARVRHVHESDFAAADFALHQLEIERLCQCDLIVPKPTVAKRKNKRPLHPGGLHSVDRGVKRGEVELHLTAFVFDLDSVGVPEPLGSIQSIALEHRPFAASPA